MLRGKNFLVLTNTLTLSLIPMATHPAEMNVLFAAVLLALIALLDHGANEQAKYKTDGEYCTIYLNVLEHCLHRMRDNFIYAYLQRRDDTSHRQMPFVPDTLKDMIKRGDKIRAAHLAGLPKPAARKRSSPSKTGRRKR